MNPFTSLPISISAAVRRLLFLLGLLGGCSALLPAQSWEEVRLETFTGADFNLTNVADLTAAAFQRHGYGASGAPGDYCARGNFLGASYLAFAAELSSAYEYRFSWNLKATGAGRKAVFRYAAAAGTAGTDVSPALSVPQLGLSQPGQTFLSDVFGGLDGTYHLILAPGDGNGGLIFTQVHADDFRLERRPAAAVAVAFQTADLTLAEGGSAQVCLAPAAAPAAPVTAAVSLASPPSPHFDDFQPPTLSFPAGSTQPQCFSLTTDAPNGLPDSAFLYTFTLAVTGGPGQAGAPAALKVTVTDDAPPCPGFAGADRTVCRGDTTRLGCAPVDTLCYKWMPEEGLDAPYSAQPLARPQETRVYTVYVTDEQGDLIAIEAVTVEAPALPDLQLQTDPDPPILCAGDSLTLHAGGGYDTYEWSVAGPSDSLLLVTEPGLYSVTVTNAAGCAAADTVEVVNAADSTASAAAIRQFFTDRGFFAIPINILGDDLVMRNSLPPDLVRDEAQLRIGWVDDDFNPREELEHFLDPGNDLLGGISGNRKGFITKNDNFCEPDGNLFADIESEFHNQELGYWFHLWKNPATGGSDSLFIGAKLPDTTGLVISPTTGYRPFLDGLAPELYQDPNPYSFPSVDRKVVVILTHILLENSVDGDLSQVFVPGPGAFDEVCEETDSLICLSGAGVPVRLIPGARIRFGLQPKYQGRIDDRALAGFSYLDDGPDRGIYYGAVKPTTEQFVGYYNTYTGEYYEWAGPAVEGAVDLQTGTYIPNPSCPYYFKYQTGFLPNDALATPGGLPNRKGDGPFAANFADPSVGSFVNDGQTLPGSETICRVCPPDISLENFNQPVAVVFDPYHPLNPGDSTVNGNTGWMFVVLDEQGNQQMIHAAYTAASPDVPLYHLLLPDGTWQPYDPPAALDLDFLTALVDVLIQNGHLGLDLVGAVPLVGELADLVNAVWYAAEGDGTNAALSAAAVLFFLDVELKGGKYVFKNLDAAGNARELEKVVRARRQGNTYQLVLFVDEAGEQTADILDWLGRLTYEKGFSLSQAKRVGGWLLHPDHHDILFTFGQHPGLLDAWKALDEAGGSAGQAATLFGRLGEPGNEALLQAFVSNADLAKAWKVIADGHQGPGVVRPWDLELINKVHDLLLDPDFLTIIKDYRSDVQSIPEAIEKFSLIIAHNHRAVCCGMAFNAGNFHLSPIDDYLENIKVFLIGMRDNGIDGISKFIGRITGNNEVFNDFYVDEANQLVRLVNEGHPDFDISFFTAFDEVFPQTSKRFDLRKGNIDDSDFSFYELKSWKSIGEESGEEVLDNIRIQLKKQENFDQLKAYFQNVGSVSEFRYSFDAGKILIPDDYFPELSFEARQLRWVKEQFQKFFQDKSDEIYQANPSLFSDYTLPSTGQQVTNENVAAFFTEIDIDHPVFSFIHVE